MKLEWIEDILAVHDTGSLRGAANQRFLTASAFTRRIKSIEEAIGQELFDRSTKPVTLRAHVVELVPRMRDTATQLRKIRSELNGEGDAAQTMRLICQHTVSVSWAPNVARTLSTEGRPLRIRSASRHECLNSVLKNESQLALVYQDPSAAIDTSNDMFDSFHLGTEVFIPVAALKENDELCRQINAGRYPLIVYPRSIFLGEMLDRTLAPLSAAKFKLSTVAEAGLGPAVLEFVREGFGVGWLPESIVRSETRSGALASLVDALPSFSLNVISIKAKSVADQPTELIWQKLEEQFGRRDLRLVKPERRASRG